MLQVLSKNLISGKCYRDGAEITEEKYTEILNMIRNKPTAPDGYGYSLTDDLKWELMELPVTPEDADPDITDEEALAIILGGAE